MDNDLAVLEREHLRALEGRGYATSTIANRRTHLSLFIRWLRAGGVNRASEVTLRHLERYRFALARAHQEDGHPLSRGTQAQRLSAVRTFFAWMTRTGRLSYNPAADLELPRRPRRLPRVVLTAEEAESVLARPDIGDPLGVRDRAILELLYSTGIRRTECSGIHLDDLHLERRLLFVREGKGGHDRVVPVGDRAIRWIRCWMDDGRRLFARNVDPGSMFLTRSGRRVGPKRLSELVARYIQDADLGKRGSCHLFRHTMATLMLEGGADIRHIQEILGHSQLSTTALYTHVSVQHLQEVHRRTHPARLYATGMPNQRSWPPGSVRWSHGVTPGKNRPHRYQVILRWCGQHEAYVAQVPRLPGCTAHGSTYQGAIEKAEFLIEEWINDARRLGRRVPEPIRLLECE